MTPSSLASYLRTSHCLQQNVWNIAPKKQLLVLANQTQAFKIELLASYDPHMSPPMLTFDSIVKNTILQSQ